MHAQVDVGWLPLLLSIIDVETVSLSKPGALKFSKTGWLLSPRDCPVFVPLPLEIQARNAAPSLLYGCWGSKAVLMFVWQSSMRMDASRVAEPLVCGPCWVAKRIVFFWLKDGSHRGSNSDNSRNSKSTLVVKASRRRATVLPTDSPYIWDATGRGSLLYRRVFPAI